MVNSRSKIRSLLRKFTLCLLCFCLNDLKKKPVPCVSVDIFFVWLSRHVKSVAPHLSSVLMCSAGQSMNRWSLEEMVKRDPENFLILLQQIIRKAREVRAHRTKNILSPSHACFFTHTCLTALYACLWFTFRFRSSVSMSWWLLSRSCSSPHCFRYEPLPTSHIVRHFTCVKAHFFKSSLALENHSSMSLAQVEKKFELQS